MRRIWAAINALRSRQSKISLRLESCQSRLHKCRTNLTGTARDDRDYGYILYICDATTTPHVILIYIILKYLATSSYIVHKIYICSNTKTMQNTAFFVATHLLDVPYTCINKMTEGKKK